MVIGMQLQALTPPNVTIMDLLRHKHDACHRLAEARRTRQRQRIFHSKSLT